MEMTKEEREALTPEAKLAKEQADAKAEADAEAKTKAEQDSLKIELERVKNAGEKTEKEKAEYTLKKNAERVKALGGTPEEVLGIRTEEIEEDDDKPITVGMYKKLQRDSATKSALQLADDIQSETERELVKYHLENTIKPTGNPTEDLRLARTLTNAAKNAQIMEEINRKIPAKTFSSGSGVDRKQEQELGELTAVEKKFLGKPWKMTKEQIIAARKPQSQRTTED